MRRFAGALRHRADVTLDVSLRVSRFGACLTRGYFSQFQRCDLALHVGIVVVAPFRRIGVFRPVAEEAR